MCVLLCQTLVYLCMCFCCCGLWRLRGRRTYYTRAQRRNAGVREICVRLSRGLIHGGAECAHNFGAHTHTHTLEVWAISFRNPVGSRCRWCVFRFGCCYIPAHATPDDISARVGEQRPDARVSSASSRASIESVFGCARTPARRDKIHAITQRSSGR